MIKIFRFCTFYKSLRSNTTRSLLFLWEMASKIRYHLRSNFIHKFHIGLFGCGFLSIFRLFCFFLKSTYFQRHKNSMNIIYILKMLLANRVYYYKINNFLFLALLNNKKVEVFLKFALIHSKSDFCHKLRILIIQLIIFIRKIIGNLNHLKKNKEKYLDL